MSLVKRVESLSSGASVSYSSEVSISGCQVLVGAFGGQFGGGYAPAVGVDDGITWWFKGSVDSPLEMEDAGTKVGMLCYSAVGSWLYVVMLADLGDGEHFMPMVMYQPSDDDMRQIPLADVVLSYGSVFELGFTWSATTFLVYLNGSVVHTESHTTSWDGVSYSEGWGLNCGAVMYLRSLTVGGWGTWTHVLSGSEMANPLGVTSGCLLSFDMGVCSGEGVHPAVNGDGVLFYDCRPISGYLGPDGDYVLCGLAGMSDGFSVSVSSASGSYNVWYYDPEDSGPVSGLEFRCLSPAEGARLLEVRSGVRGPFDKQGDVTVQLQSLGLGGAVAELTVAAGVWSLDMDVRAVTTSVGDFSVSSLGNPRLVYKSSSGEVLSSRDVPLRFYVGPDAVGDVDALLSGTPYTASIIGFSHNGVAGFYSVEFSEKRDTTFTAREATTFKARCCYYELAGGSEYEAVGLLLGPEVTVQIGGIYPTELHVSPTTLSVGASGGYGNVSLTATMYDEVLKKSGTVNVRSGVTYDSGTASAVGVADAWCYAGSAASSGSVGSGSVVWSGLYLPFYCNSRGSVVGGARTAHVVLSYTGGGHTVSGSFDMTQAENKVTSTGVRGGVFVGESFELPAAGIHSESVSDNIITLTVGAGDITLPPSGGTYIINAADGVCHGSVSVKQEVLYYSSGASSVGSILEPARTEDRAVTPYQSALLYNGTIASAGTTLQTASVLKAWMTSVTYRWYKGSSLQEVSTEEYRIYQDKNIVESVERTGGEVTETVTDYGSDSPTTAVIPANGGTASLLFSQIEVIHRVAAVYDVSTYSSGATSQKRVSSATRTYEYVDPVPSEVEGTAGPKAAGLPETVVASAHIVWTSEYNGVSKVIKEWDATIYQASTL